MSQFYQVFFEESAEHLAAMESLLLDLDVGNPDAEQLNAIFRAAHSIKGSAGTFGFTDLAETTHILESLLDRIRKQELALRPEMVDACLQCGDLLKGMLGAHQGQGAVDVAAVQANGARLRELATDRAAAAPPAEPVVSPAAAEPAETAPHGQRVFVIQFVPTELSASGDGVNNLLEELKLLGQLEIVRQPDTGVHSVGFWEVRLCSDFGQEAFTDQIDFIADNGAWRVLESAPEGEPDEKPFGLFADAPGAPVEEAAYGLFEPSEYADESGAPPTPADDEAYGFFAPLPQVAAFTAAADDSYGFFEPLPGPVAQPVSEPAVATPVAPEGRAGADVAVAEKPPAGMRGRQPRSASDASIRVSVEKVDQLINLVGELVITQAMLLQTAGQMQDSAPERLLNGLTQLERNTRDLQESVMSIRMLPISFVFSRFPRVVRDLSAKLCKQVELKTSGETTELDKGLIERIADPLTHLIRNSLDHGIELPEQRVAAGKSPVGTITLKASHQGGNIVIEVGDDGAGLSRQRILAKARERGLPVADQMSDQEVFALIFEAGFSTAEQVTDVSGRGVGMDVVRRNIQSMGGRVEIDSMPGIGTRMTVRLPLTLAILDGMSIAVGEQTYIMPLSHVVESFQPRPGEVKTLSNQARVIQVRGDYLPVLALHELFNIESPAEDFAQGIVVVVDADGIKAALFVDALLGQHQVVIKSLEANYRRVHGISGATIMGDGQVALILDLVAIAGLARSSVQRAG
ncbi:chemotaxis protein CheW [Dechloromonas sp. XY25]|uniref:Chemotaxis protein CheA n=1 Tax=Dechloromonas hankyongensis TaxID=2908002 RepID=A0ABS9K6R5_9RHOO|nr:chemotaxis protein CheW [Dechloromonas hankyongensis]MCG2578815.1 chemotaxis protein CheW [Dechloromonas hankyongensis]